MRQMSEQLRSVLRGDLSLLHPLLSLELCLLNRLRKKQRLKQCKGRSEDKERASEKNRSGEEEEEEGGEEQEEEEKDGHENCFVIGGR